MRAEAAHQALCRDQADTGGDVVGGRAHVAQAHQSSRGVVGVKGREHEMPGLCRLNSDVGGLQITDLAHHQNVRVLAQKSPKRHSKAQARFVLHVDLVDACELDFTRIFHCGDVHLRGIEQVQAGVKGLGLA